MGLIEYLNTQKNAAMNDYAGLLKFYPNATNFGNAVAHEMDGLVPKMEDYDVKAHPERMIDWSMGVFGGQYGIPVNNLRSGLLK
jgi:hypothetical protein